MTRPMPCAYCDRDATVRPVRYEAVCWWCWWKMYGEETAVRNWRRRRWWRRLIP